MYLKCATFQICSTCMRRIPHSQQNFAVATGYFVPQSWQKFANFRRPLGVLSSLSDVCREDGRTTPTAVGLVIGAPKSSSSNWVGRLAGLIGFSSKSKTSFLDVSRCRPLCRPLDPAELLSDFFLSGSIELSSAFLNPFSHAGCSFL